MNSRDSGITSVVNNDPQGRLLAKGTKTVVAVVQAHTYRLSRCIPLYYTYYQIKKTLVIGRNAYNVANQSTESAIDSQ